MIVPPCCAACRVPSEGDGPLCPDCLARLPRIVAACPACALPSHGGRACSAARSAFDAARAPFAYAGPARSLVLGLKAGGRLPLAAWMAHAMAPLAGGWGSPGPAALVPVPGSPRRRRHRGFDPAALLAAGLSAASGLPAEPVLRRRDASRRQVGAGRADRRAPGRVRVEAVARAPAVAFLVDDVHTTGATLDACARALKEAGTRRVTALTFARSL